MSASKLIKPKMKSNSNPDLDLDYFGNLDQTEMNTTIDEMSDETLQFLAQGFAPWQSPVSINDRDIVTDSDGFSISMDKYTNFSTAQKKCFEKSLTNPHLNSHVRDMMGSLTGDGWNISSYVEEINSVIYEEMYDIRNELYKNIPKFVARSEAEGELFLAFTLHKDGFVEIDFLPPHSLSGGGDYSSGIYFHPRKSTLPLFYEFEIKVNDKNGVEKTEKEIIPSIYIAHYPDFVKERNDVSENQLKNSKGNSSKYKNLGGFKRFIVSWDKGFLIPRNLSHISTVLEWINHYVNLKKWEIDHKKSAGSYLWVVSLTDSKAFRTWLKMTPEQKKETGLTSKKTPGGTLILPPGVTIEVKNPQLPNISEQDTDIMHMITSGLNKPEDMVTGQTKGDTFSGVKASRGPQADRIFHEISYFHRFLKYDFWRSIFVLRNKMVGFPLTFPKRKAVDFKNKKPVFKNIEIPTWELVEFDFPTSQIGDIDSIAKALLGVKHGSIVETLGIPRSAIAKKIGFGSYFRNRLQYETEDEELPDLPLTAELDSIEEKAQEPSVGDSEDNNSIKNKKVKLKKPKEKE